MALVAKPANTERRLVRYGEQNFSHDSTTAAVQQQRREIYKPGSRDNRVRVWRQPVPSAPHAYFLIARPISDEVTIEAAFCRIDTCLDSLRRKGLLLPKLQALDFLDDQNRMTVKLIFPRECNHRPAAFEECMFNIIAIMHHLPSVDPPDEARSMIVKQLTIIGNKHLNISVPRWPPNTDFMRPDNSPKMVDLWYRSLARTVERVWTHMDGELEAGRPTNTVHRSPAAIGLPDAFTELEDFDQLLDEVTRVLLGSVCIGVAAQSKLENQTALQEIVTRLSINAGRAAEMKRSICGLFEKIIQIDETDGLSLEQECQRRLAAGHAAWLSCLTELIDANKCFAQLVTDTKSIVHVLRKEMAVAMRKQSIALAQAAILAVAWHYNGISGSFAFNVGSGAMTQAWTFADHRESLTKLEVLIRRHISLSQGFRIQLWELRDDMVAQETTETAASMERLKLWAGHIDKHAKNMARLEEGIANSIMDIFGALIRPLSNTARARKIQYNGI